MHSCRTKSLVPVADADVNAVLCLDLPVTVVVDDIASMPVVRVVAVTKVH